MKFAIDVDELGKVPSQTYNLVGMKLPNNNDLFFRSKQQEIIEQYRTTRLFLAETETNDWNHWFNPPEDDTANIPTRLKLRSQFYEAALFFYNVVVDLSWTLCYVSAASVYK